MHIPDEDLHMTLALVSVRKLMVGVSVMSKTATKDCFEPKYIIIVWA